MSDSQSSELRVAPATSTGINALIAAANKHDRFKLLEDDSLPAGNLKNVIHPIFEWFDVAGPMSQALQLASQFIAHDSVLTFFVPLIYGRELITTVNGVHNSYLSNPLTNASDARKTNLLHGVRNALLCLSHSIQFDWSNDGNRVHARTTSSAFKPMHGPFCCIAFQRNVTPRVDVNERFKKYYDDYRNGYLTASRCAQFRSDFILATTLVHELVHAVGVMRRGHTREESIRCDHYITEWGYWWEHFMFGSIMNAQDRGKPGTYLIMRKVLGDIKAVEEAHGKEYGTVPMVYIAQWFRQDTWDVVAQLGPLAIPQPTCHFKVQSSNKIGAWIVTTDNDNIKPDVIALYRVWQQEKNRLAALGIPSTSSYKIMWRESTPEKMLKHNVALPPRDPRGFPASDIKPRLCKVACAIVSKGEKSTIVQRTVPLNASGIPQKRKVQATIEAVPAAKIVKR